MSKGVDIDPLVELGNKWLKFAKEVYGYGKEQYERFAVPQLSEIAAILRGRYTSPLASKLMSYPIYVASSAAQQAKQQVLESDLGPVQTQRLLSSIDVEKMNTLASQAMAMIGDMLNALISGGQFAYQTGVSGAVGFGQIGSSMMQTAYQIQAQAAMQGNRTLFDALSGIVALGTYITGPQGFGLWGKKP